MGAGDALDFVDTFSQAGVVQGFVDDEDIASCDDQEVAIGGVEGAEGGRSQTDAELGTLDKLDAGVRKIPLRDQVEQQLTIYSRPSMVAITMWGPQGLMATMALW